MVLGMGGQKCDDEGGSTTSPPETNRTMEIIDDRQGACGVNKYNTRIVNGRNALPDEWPWQVFLILGKNSQIDMISKIKFFIVYFK